MSGGWQIGTFRGIPIALHWSMLLIFALLVTSLATSFFPLTHPDLPDAAHWIIAVGCALLFFGSILLHELGHAVVAQRQGIPVDGIMLFIFGGVAQIGGRSPTALIDLKIAVAGPIVSLLLALLFWTVSWMADGIDYLAAPATWLAGLNLIMALFNLLPGFPLDGGRILRALVWRFSGSEERAAQVAQVSGQVLAFGMMGAGVFFIIRGNAGNGLWLIVLGWFLRNAAATESASSRLEIALRGVRVGEVIGPRETIIPSWMKLRPLLEEYVLDRGESAFLVIDDDIPRGVVTLPHIAKVPQSRLDWASVSEIMTPWGNLTYVTPDTGLIEAMKLMEDAHVTWIPVMEGEHPAGLLTRDKVMSYIRLRMDPWNRSIAPSKA